RDDQLLHTAISAAKQLRRDNYSDDIEWFEEILAWIIEFGGSGRVGTMPEYSPEYRAKRIALPHGTKANVTLISFSLPCQKHWVPGLPKPYIKVSMPAVKVVGKLHKFLDTLFTPGYVEEGTKVIVEAKAKVPFVLGTIAHSTNPTTTAFEGDTPLRLNSRENTLSSKFWTYSTAFQSSPDVYNFLKAFPGLATSFENGEFDSEARQVVQALQSVPCGHAFVGGGPDSGKTTVATKIVRAIVSGGVSRDCLVVEHKSFEDAGNDQDATETKSLPKVRAPRAMTRLSIR
ncbi:hypothetical protein FGRMN_7256, partial [Fusarium graminum]